MMLLVIDVKMGIQCQTAECIVIGEILDKQLMIVVNKIDTLTNDTSKKDIIDMMEKRLRKTFANTKFGASVPIYFVSALEEIGIDALLTGILDNLQLPKRLGMDERPFLMYVDHCFPIKGQGTALLLPPPSFYYLTKEFRDNSLPSPPFY